LPRDLIALDRYTTAIPRRYRNRCRTHNLAEPAGFLFTGDWDEPPCRDSIIHLFRKLNDASGLPPVRSRTGFSLAVSEQAQQADQVGGDPAERIRPSAIRLALWPKDRCPQTPGTVH